jgi:hypothetical protein
MKWQKGLIFSLSLVVGLTTEVTGFAGRPLTAACQKLNNPDLAAVVSELPTQSSALKKLELELAKSLKDNCGNRAVALTPITNCVRSLAQELEGFDQTFGTRDAEEQMIAGIQYQANLKSLCGKISDGCVADLKRETRDFGVKDFPDVVKECGVSSGKLTDVNAQSCTTKPFFVVTLGTSNSCKIACCAR